MRGRRKEVPTKRQTVPGPSSKGGEGAGMPRSESERRLTCASSPGDTETQGVPTANQEGRRGIVEISGTLKVGQRATARNG